MSNTIRGAEIFAIGTHNQMTFSDKDLDAIVEAFSKLESEAEAFLEQAGGWPIATQVPLSRVAFVLAALMRQPDPNVRRVMVTDRCRLGDTLG